MMAQSRFMHRVLNILTISSRRLTDLMEPDLFLRELSTLLKECLGAVAGSISVFHPAWSDTGSADVFTFPEHLRDEITTFLGESGSNTELGTEPLLVSPGEKEQAPASALGGDLRRLELPLLSRDEHIGRITLWIPAEVTEELSVHRKLTMESRDMLATLGTEIGLRVMNSILRRLADRLGSSDEKRLREMWILQETNNALRGTLQLNRILKMILAGATVEMGLGFNRAALFLLNERTSLLQGMLGVGPDSAEEAEHIWRSLTPESKLSLSRQIELFASSQPQRSHFDAIVKGIRIHLGHVDGTLAECARKRIAMRVSGRGDSPPPEKVLASKLSMTVFAVTPIIARGQIFGLMVVDNLFDEKTITDEDVRLLSMFAGQAGLAIANAKEHNAHRRAVEELRMTRDLLVQTERLAVLGEVASSLAHEIRNPLVSIGGFARRLERKLDRRDPNKKYAGIISNEVQRLEDFLEEVLLFGKDRQPRFSPVHLNDIIEDTLRLFSANFNEAGIQVVTSLSPSLPAIEADANQLRQISINLFSNAVEAMPQGGDLGVTTALDDGPPAAVSFSVSDSGGGVEPEVLGNIFNPFFTTKSGGHGLGLALAQRIVAGHSGHLGVKNHPGKGLTFTISLPLPSGRKFSQVAGHRDSYQRRSGDENGPGCRRRRKHS